MKETVDDSSSLWILLALLAAQAALAVTRTVLNRARWEIDEERIIARPDITNLSIAVDLAMILTVGLYFILGFNTLHPRLSAQQAGNLPDTTWRWLSPLITTLFILFLGWINLVLGYLTPEALGHSLPAHWADRATGLARSLAWVLRPISMSAQAVSNLLAGWMGGGPLQRFAVITEDQIKSLITASEQEGYIEEGEREMIYSIFRLGDMITREVMVPRIDVVALDVQTPLLEALKTIVASGHSRIPVYQETVDNIIGILYVKDLLHYQSNGTEPTLSEILREAYFVPESKQLDNLLREMQEDKVQLAIVVDEYGGVAGLITLEDIVEEIVGEIQDEYDREEPEFQLLPQGGYLFDARIPLDDVQELLNIPLPLEEADSLGGFVYNQLGHIPSVGEQLVFEGIVFEVLEITGRRIRKVKAMPLPLTEETIEP